MCSYFSNSTLNLQHSSKSKSLHPRSQPEGHLPAWKSKASLEMPSASESGTCSPPESGHSSGLCHSARMGAGGLLRIRPSAPMGWSCSLQGCQGRPAWWSPRALLRAMVGEGSGPPLVLSSRGQFWPGGCVHRSLVKHKDKFGHHFSPDRVILSGVGWSRSHPMNPRVPGCGVTLRLCCACCSLLFNKKVLNWG